MFYPMNLDFRGRVYPIPPHLNHMGNDLCRGLLSFARKKPLGERGLFWLKIQVANLYGNDKVGVEWESHKADLLRGPREVGGREYGPHSGVREEPDGAGRVVEGRRRSLATVGDVHGVREGGGRTEPRGVPEQHPSTSGGGGSWT